MANLFQKAAKKSKETTTKSKPKGTVIELPKELDGDGKLTGDSAHYHKAVHDMLEAERELKAAKNKANLAKGTLGKYVHPEVVRLLAENGVLPPTPIKVQDHKGQAVTYVVTDKSQQYPLKDDQITELQEILGETKADEITDTVEVYAFDPDCMNETLQEGEGTVADVVFEIVSKAVTRNTKLTDDQKERLIRQDVVTRLIAGFPASAAVHCGRDAVRIEEVFDVCKSQVVRYLKSS